MRLGRERDGGTVRSVGAAELRWVEVELRASITMPGLTAAANSDLCT